MSMRIALHDVSPGNVYAALTATTLRVSKRKGEMLTLRVIPGGDIVIITAICGSVSSITVTSPAGIYSLDVPTSELLDAVLIARSLVRIDCGPAHA